MTKTPTVSTAARTFLAVATLAATSLLGMNAATAHDELISTNPADGSSLSQAPHQLELTFSGEIMKMDGANQVRVTNAAGENVTQGDPEIKGDTVTQNLATGAENDTYTVTWRVVSSDGHPIQGTLSYKVGQGAASGKESSLASAEATQSPASSGLAADSQNSAAQGLSTPVKLALAVLALAALGGSIAVIVAKTKRK